MGETGYVSSFDEHEGFGFIRPIKDPRRVVRFRQSDLGKGAEDYIHVGQEVIFERDPNAPDHEVWDVAVSVEIGFESADEAEADVTSESEAL